MSTSRLYYWDGSKVIKHSSWLINRLDTDNMLCVDTRYPDSRNRYGMNDGEAWTHIPLEEFDPVFRTHLLLLGVV